MKNLLGATYRHRQRSPCELVPPFYWMTTVWLPLRLCMQSNDALFLRKIFEVGGSLLECMIDCNAPCFAWSAYRSIWMSLGIGFVLSNNWPIKSINRKNWWIFACAGVGTIIIFPTIKTCLNRTRINPSKVGKLATSAYLKIGLLKEWTCNCVPDWP